MRSEFLDIPVYEDHELAEILGETIIRREKLHHWQRPMKAPVIIDRVTCGLENDPDAVCLCKIFETYWLLYAFDKKLCKLPHVINWAVKNLEEILN